MSEKSNAPRNDLIKLSLIKNSNSGLYFDSVSGRLLLLPDEELIALNKEVSSWRLFASWFYNSLINLERCANCCVRVSVTALICQATYSIAMDYVWRVLNFVITHPIRSICNKTFGLSTTLYVSCPSTSSSWHRLKNRLLFSSFIVEKG